MLFAQTIRVNDTIYRSAPDYLFDEARWPTLLGYAEAGRGNAAFVRDEAGICVVRHYRRGGLVAKLVDRHYLALGATRSRSIREFELLQHLFDQGLPVPEPVAARYRRRGVLYTASLVTRALPAATSLAKLVGQDVLDASHWHQLGVTLQRFHLHGVRHADLNAHNILRVDEHWYLIDFDRGRICAAGAWQQHNLARLQRSLNKVMRQVGGLRAQDWDSVLAGYNTSLDKSA
ncbi:MAG: 3-deoxy-D-manno-octulosonic acid kinase [Pseudomonadota bacterium]